MRLTPRIQATNEPVSYNPRTKAGKAGRAASPWGKFPHCDSPRAVRMFAKAKREKAIEDAAKAVKAKGNPK